VPIYEKAMPRYTKTDAFSSNKRKSVAGAIQSAVT
jgi:hypothetical protein